MAERLIVTIATPSDDRKTAAVQEIFAQIVDLFEMAAHNGVEAEEMVVWRFISANTKSPLTVVAEAVPVRPGIDITQIAPAQKEEFLRNLESLRRGEFPEVWSEGGIRKTVERLIERSRSGMGEIKVKSQDDVREAAEVALSGLAEVHAEPIDVLQENSIPKIQMGSLEGILIEVGMHYNKPAIKLLERKSGHEIWCIIPNERQDEIAGGTDFSVVWHGQRVVLQGSIEYDPYGNIAKMTANHLKIIDSDKRRINEIQDNEFTGGLSPVDYLEKLREGDIG